jgi:carbamoyltransferase
MIVLAVQIGHNSSVCLYDNKKLIYYNQEERLSKLKKDGGIPFLCLEEIKKIYPKIDIALCTGYDATYTTPLVYYALLRLNLIKKNDKVYYLYYSHHLMHAAKAYFSSGFKNTTIIVVDGRGSIYPLSNMCSGYETTSVYSIQYPNEFNAIFKKIYSKNYLQNKVDIIFEHDALSISKDTVFEITSKYDLGHFYSSISNYFKWKDEEGKLMGLSAYGKSNKDIKKLISKKDFLIDLNINNKYKITNKKDLAFEAQNYFEENYFNLVNRFKDLNKNIIITGGTGLNVVNNFKIKKYFKNNNIYIDPLCGDEGNSIGACQYFLYKQYNNDDFEKVNSLYLGPVYNFNIKKNIKKSSLNEVCDLLVDNKIVALYQNKAEAGPRALGNRSLLMNPCTINGKDIMNSVKGREYFRPLACCVLEEHAEEWFDLKYSPDMMYAVTAKEKTKKIVPSIVHEDNTCRIQTINKNQNKNLYNLLNLFYKKTKVPILMNTSFNLKGEPIVETPEDAVSVIKKSKINYLYFSEVEKLYKCKNKYD